HLSFCVLIYFFFQAEDGIRDRNVTGVQTCALPIFMLRVLGSVFSFWRFALSVTASSFGPCGADLGGRPLRALPGLTPAPARIKEIGRASCRERVQVSVWHGELLHTEDECHADAGQI